MKRHSCTTMGYFSLIYCSLAILAKASCLPAATPCVKPCWWSGVNGASNGNIFNVESPPYQTSGKIGSGGYGGYNGYIGHSGSSNVVDGGGSSGSIGGCGSTRNIGGGGTSVLSGLGGLSSLGGGGLGYLQVEAGGGLSNFINGVGSSGLIGNGGLKGIPELSGPANNGGGKLSGISGGLSYQGAGETLKFASSRGGLSGYFGDGGFSSFSDLSGLSNVGGGGKGSVGGPCYINNINGGGSAVNVGGSESTGLIGGGGSSRSAGLRRFGSIGGGGISGLSGSFSYPRNGEYSGYLGGGKPLNFVSGGRVSAKNRVDGINAFSDLKELNYINAGPTGWSGLDCLSSLRNVVGGGSTGFVSGRGSIGYSGYGGPEYLGGYKGYTSGLGDFWNQFAPRTENVVTQLNYTPNRNVMLPEYYSQSQVIAGSIDPHISLPQTSLPQVLFTNTNEPETIFVPQPVQYTSVAPVILETPKVQNVPLSPEPIVLSGVEYASVPQVILEQPHVQYSPVSLISVGSSRAEYASVPQVVMEQPNVQFIGGGGSSGFDGLGGFVFIGGGDGIGGLPVDFSYPGDGGHLGDVKGSGKSNFINGGRVSANIRGDGISGFSGPRELNYINGGSTGCLELGGLTSLRNIGRGGLTSYISGQGSIGYLGYGGPEYLRGYNGYTSGSANSWNQYAPRAENFIVQPNYTPNRNVMLPEYCSQSPVITESIDPRITLPQTSLPQVLFTNTNEPETIFVPQPVQYTSAAPVILETPNVQYAPLPLESVASPGVEYASVPQVVMEQPSVQFIEGGSLNGFYRLGGYGFIGGEGGIDGQPGDVGYLRDGGYSGYVGGSGSSNFINSGRVSANVRGDGIIGFSGLRKLNYINGGSTGCLGLGGLTSLRNDGGGGSTGYISGKGSIGYSGYGGPEYLRGYNDYTSGSENFWNQYAPRLENFATQRSYTSNRNVMLSEYYSQSQITAENLKLVLPPISYPETLFTYINKPEPIFVPQPVQYAPVSPVILEQLNVQYAPVPSMIVEPTTQVNLEPPRDEYVSLPPVIIEPTNVEYKSLPQVIPQLTYGLDQYPANAFYNQLQSKPYVAPPAYDPGYNLATNGYFGSRQITSLSPSPSSSFSLCRCY